MLKKFYTPEDIAKDSESSTGLTFDISENQFLYIEKISNTDIEFIRNEPVDETRNKLNQYINRFGFPKPIQEIDKETDYLFLGCLYNGEWVIVKQYSRLNQKIVNSSIDEVCNEELYNAGYFIDFNTKRIFHLTRPLN